MPGSRSDVTDVTYPLGAVSRLTGLSEHVLRAWERRYGAVVPVRTSGGTRRYRESDISRLRLLAAAVQAGHPISDVAALPDEALLGVVGATPRAPRPSTAPVLDAIARLDLPAAEQLVAFQIAALGPTRFAREFAVPLLHEIGDAWETQRICVASEHLASALLRSLLGAALRPSPASSRSAPIILSTPAGERHELGTLIAALCAQSVGGNPLYLGPDLPSDELVAAAATLNAAAIVLGVATLAHRELLPILRELRERLPAHVELWIGGPASEGLDVPDGVLRLADLDALEQRVGLLGEKRRSC